MLPPVHCAQTPLIGLIILATDVIGMKRMILQGVPNRETLMEMYLVIAAIALRIVSLTLPIGLIVLVPDVIGMKKMIFQAVPNLDSWMEIWDIHMKIAATV